MKRNVYLTMKPLAEARALFLGAWDWAALAGTERVDAASALGRVTAAPVFAALSSPSYHAAAMDGIAVDAAATYAATEEQPVQLAVGAAAHFVNTGQPLPAGTNAVVMIEHIHEPAAGLVELRAAAFPWQHVRKVGEDIVATELVLPHHHRLSAADVAALLAAGVFELTVLCRPRVAIIPTGAELVDWREAAARPPAPGAIIESNSVFLAALVTEHGGEPRVLPRQPDDPAALRAALAAALASDAHLVMTNAGASAGSKDFTSHVLGEVGEVLVHGIAAMPGKPTVLGRAAGKPVVGTPGYPISAWVCFDQFVRPALALMQGQPPPAREIVMAVPARRLPSRLGQEELVRVHLGQVGDRVVAAPLKRGAGAITSLTRADGLLRIPAQSEGLDESEPVPVELLRPRAALARTLVVVGSHDIVLDLLADELKRRAPDLSLSSSNLGSLAGLIALRDGRAHCGGTHLLDPATGEYNVPDVRRYLAGTPALLVTVAWRSQGLIVAPGNPKGLRVLADLARPDVTFVNRQAGSGTRVLLDHALAQAGLDPARIRGYDDDEYTHTAVAAQVRAGGVDAGLGIKAAADALGCDFVPLFRERYDLCIAQRFLGDPRVVALLETLRAPELARAVAALGGYDTAEMGRVAWEG
ncbi:MAG TPA: molybdopterin biosynthesis protein [Polyangia bacterium]|jgi:putative molybdopterin biosynthesis protein